MKIEKMKTKETKDKLLAGYQNIRSKNNEIMKICWQPLASEKTD